MPRFASLIVFCFLALLFCTIAYTIQQDSPFLTEQKKQSSLPSGERTDHLKERKAALNSIFKAESAPSDRETTLFGGKADENKETVIVNKPQLEAAKPERPGRKEGSSTALPYHQAEDAVHFLLIGRWWKNPSAEILMIVTLVPESCARLTAIDPAIEVTFEEQLCPIGELLARGADHDCLYRAIAELSGLKPQFYIDLNLDGFIEMIDLLHKKGHKTASTVTSECTQLTGGGGKDLLSLLCDFKAQTAVKEELLIGYLLMARDIQSTSLGLKLLWIGYQSLTTDLGLSDLVQVRDVTGKISPLEVSLTVITQ